MQPPAAEEYGAFAAEIGGNAAGQGLAAALFLAGRWFVGKYAVGEIPTAQSYRRMRPVNEYQIAPYESGCLLGDDRRGRRRWAEHQPAGGLAWVFLPGIADRDRVPLDLLAAPAHRSPLSPPGTVRGRCVVSDSGPFRDLRADVRRGKRRRCLWRAWVGTALSLTGRRFESCLGSSSGPSAPTSSNPGWDAHQALFAEPLGTGGWRLVGTTDPTLPTVQPGDGIRDRRCCRCPDRSLRQIDHMDAQLREELIRLLADCVAEIKDDWPLVERLLKARTRLLVEPDDPS